MDSDVVGIFDLKAHFPYSPEARTHVGLRINERREIEAARNDPGCRPQRWARPRDLPGWRGKRSRSLPELNRHLPPSQGELRGPHEACQFEAGTKAGR